MTVITNRQLYNFYLKSIFANKKLVEGTSKKGDRQIPSKVPFFGQCPIVPLPGDLLSKIPHSLALKLFESFMTLF